LFIDADAAHIYVSILSLHDALPILRADCGGKRAAPAVGVRCGGNAGPIAARQSPGIAGRFTGAVGEKSSSAARRGGDGIIRGRLDRKSTRLNSSHLGISYAVFCLKK